MGFHKILLKKSSGCIEDYIIINIPNKKSKYEYFYYVYIWKQLYDKIDKALKTTTTQNQSNTSGNANTAQKQSNTSGDTTNTTQGATNTSGENTTQNQSNTSGENTTQNQSNTSENANTGDDNCKQLNTNYTDYVGLNNLINTLISCIPHGDKSDKLKHLLKEIKTNIANTIKIEYYLERWHKKGDKYTIETGTKLVTSKFTQITTEEKVIREGTNEIKCDKYYLQYELKLNDVTNNELRSNVTNEILKEIDNIGRKINKIGYYPTRDYENYRYNFQGGFEDSEKDFFGFFECLNYKGDNNLELDKNFFMKFESKNTINICFKVSSSTNMQLENIKLEDNNFSLFKQTIIEKLIEQGVIKEIKEIPKALAPARVRYRHLYF